MQAALSLGTFADTLLVLCMTRAQHNTRMQFTSVTTTTQTFEIELEKGRHSLSWIFSKDAAFTAGRDMAWISGLVVYGAEETTKTYCLGIKPFNWVLSS